MNNNIDNTADMAIEETASTATCGNEQVLENATDVTAEVNADEPKKATFWSKLGQVPFFKWCGAKWSAFKAKHPTIAQFVVFFILSNGITILQIAMMPLFKSIFDNAGLVDVNFQHFNVGTNFDGSPYFMFDYAAGALPTGGGGLSYFLSVQITLAIAQIINFFAQRNITFKANNNAWWAAMWYAVAYVAITFIAAALQGLYKAPIYTWFIETLAMGDFGEFLADTLTMIINCAVSFWVFFPIFKLIFKQKPEDNAQAN